MNETARPASAPAWVFAAYQTAPASEQMEKDFLTLVGSLAELSRHPAAPDLRRVARLNRLPLCPVIGFQDFPEKGFGGAVRLPGEGGSRAVVVGHRAFAAECGLDMPAVLEVAARRYEGEGARILLGGWDGYVRGVMRFSPEGS